MKLTKPKLKQIIKESLEDEYKEKLLQIFKAGNHEQAIELSKQVGVDFLVGANLAFADLKGINLEGMNLSGADLAFANLKGANLSGAELSGAELSYANLYNANLSGANLFGSIHNEDTIWPEGFTP